MKKTILHVIYNLNRGGAETMLTQVLQHLDAYDNILVTLSPENEFTQELRGIKHYCLFCPSILHLPLAALRLRKIIKKNQVDIVHSHLPLANFAARLATPSHIPLLSTIHTSIKFATDYKKVHIRLLDKLTFKFKKSTIIAVSNSAMEDYFSILKIKPYKKFLLYTFVDESNFSHSDAVEKKNSNFKLVSVGSLRVAKNYEYLIRAFEEIRNTNIELHIYGKGPLESKLKALIDENRVNVKLMGVEKNISKMLCNYDVYVMSSLFEGFSLSVLEAMAAELPLLLSNIPSFKEQCGDNAMYFNLSDSTDFVEKLKYFQSSADIRKRMAQDAKNYMLANYTLNHHLSKLNDIYLEALSIGNPS